MGGTEKALDFTTLRDRLVQQHPTMPRRLQQIARYVLENPDDIALNTVATVSRDAGVQPSALVRFAQSLGYNGYSELQNVFRSRLRDRWPDYRERLETLRTAGDGDAAALLDSFIEAATTSLGRLRETVAPDALDRAADTLARADTIFLLGQRRAFPVVGYLAYSLAKLGLATRLLDNVGGLLAEQALLPRPGDALLAVSFTPYTPGTVEVASAIAARGVPVVAITDSAFSPLVPFSGTWLEVVEADSGAFRSLSASLTVALTLAVLAAEKRGG